MMSLLKQNTSVLLLMLLYFGMANGQSFPQKPLTSIIIIGNDQTDEEVILRELLFSEGDIVSDSILVESHKRLMNLWLFNRIEFKPIADQSNVSLLIIITERWYFFPYPRVQLEDRDWNKITYGFGFAHENFRGMNEKLNFTILFGNRPGYHLNYLNPWLGRKAHLILGVNFNKFTMDNQLYDFKENHLDFNFYLGKYWTRNFYTILDLTRNSISVNDENKEYLQTKSDTDTNYGARFSITYDGRDLYAYPSQGFFARFWVSKWGFFVPEIDYLKYQVEFKNFYTWNELTIAGRVTTLQSMGTLPVYDRVYLGYSERIRGHFYEVYEGKHYFTGNLEFRYPIIGLKYFTFSPGLMPEFLTTNLKFGLNIALFADTGIIWKNRDEFNQENFISGWGAGLHFLLPYIEVFRFETAFNENWEAEYIFEVRTAF